MKIEKINSLLAVSLIVMGALGLAGKVMNPALGWIAIGLGTGALLWNLNRHQKFKKDFSESNYKIVVLPAIVFAGLAVVGIFGVTKMVDPSVISYSMLVASVLLAINSCYAKKEKEKEKHRADDEHLITLHQPLPPRRWTILPEPGPSDIFESNV